MKIFSKKSSIVIPTVLTVIAAISSPFIYDYFAADEKRIQYSIIADSELFDSNIIGSFDFDIVIDSLILKNLYLKTVKIENTGTLPIQSDDFETPIRVRFSNGAKIISASTVDKFPESITPEIKYDELLLEVKPLLLNPNDYFTVQLLSEDKIDQTIINARILGVTKITEIIQDERKESDVKMLIFLAFLILALTYTYGVITVAINYAFVEKKYAIARKTDLSAIQLFISILFFLLTLLFLELIGITTTWIQVIIFLIVLITPTYFIKKRRVADYKEIDSYINYDSQ